MMLFRPLPRGPFDIILADPPWSYRNDGRSLEGIASAQYKTVPFRDLCLLPVPDIAAPNSILFLWCTWPKLNEGMELMETWGFKHKTGLPWVKTYDGERPVFGVGYWFRGASEPLLVGTRGKVPAPPRGSRIGLLGDMVLKAPRGRHSQKPPDVYDLAEEVSAHLGNHRLELFARDMRPGWTMWGKAIDVLREKVKNEILE